MGKVIRYFKKGVGNGWELNFVTKVINIRIAKHQFAIWRHHEPIIQWLSQAATIPSQHQHGDLVTINWHNEAYPGQKMSGKVTGVHFYRGKVKYDLELPCYGDLTTRIYNVDSVFVLKHEPIV